jgi:uncharacterized protein (DUF362 family)
MRNKDMESVVVIERSPVAEYEKVDFKRLLVQAIDHLSGAGIPFPHSGTVFLKPNIVIGASARESITTDPHFISELIKLLLEAGVSQVFVGDSSAGFIKSHESFQAAGMAQAVLEAGGRRSSRASDCFITRQRHPGIDFCPTQSA